MVKVYKKNKINVFKKSGIIKGNKRIKEKNENNAL